MGQWMKYASILVLIFMGHLYHSNGCQIDGFNPPNPTIFTILDTFRGTIFDLGASSDVVNIIYDFGESLNGGPYVNLSFENSRFVVKTNDNYASYEENETAFSIPINVNIICTGNVAVFAMVIIQVTDTNNNAPRFKNDTLVYTIPAPVPPGYDILGCFEELIVRDIDLTTQRIIFEITDNPDFEIYDAGPSTTPKEFKARIRTTTFIRNIREPITFTITATDVDLTGDPPITTRASVSITGNPDFEVPDEPVFSQTYYLGQYTANDEVITAETIFLRSGYDQFVNFTLEGELSNNFDLLENNNVVTIRVRTPLILENITTRQILLIVRATREDTSGATATVILELPEEVPLEFERAHYVGTIEDNNLRIPQLILRRGYEGLPVSANILNEYSSYFSAVVQGNTITLSMTSLSESIINENNFIHLEIETSTARSRATTIVSLEIIKDDNITPVFIRPIYEGSYNSDMGLTLEQIVVIQGYDDTVSLSLEGDKAEYFQLQEDGPVITLKTSSIPPEIFTQQRIVLSLRANKPRTVGANTAIIITLPASNASLSNLEFDQVTYQGRIANNLTELEPITLVEGYSEAVTFSLNGVLSSYFSLARQAAVVNVFLQTPIPSALIPANRIVVLEIRASAPQAGTAHATIVFEVVIENDSPSVIQLVFDAPFYTGSYNVSDGLVLDSPIILSQGYDDSVQFTLEGESSRWFSIKREQNSVSLTLTTAIPGAVLTNNRQLVFVIVAQRPGYATAQATIVIRLTDDYTETSNLAFDRVSYQGTVINNTTNIESITLIEGYTDQVTFSLYGAFSGYFSLTRQGAGVNVLLQTPIPSTLIPANRIVVLEIRASAPQAGTAHATIVFEVVIENDAPSLIQLVFDAPFYTGSYNVSDGLVLDSPIILSQGYDDSVQFTLEGESSRWFSIKREQNSVSLTLTTAIPGAVLTNNRQLVFVIVAQRPGYATAQATIVIRLTDDYTETSNLGFDRVTYQGTVINNTTNIESITLIEGYTDEVTFSLYGALSGYFSLTRQGAVVNVLLQTPIPSTLIPANRIVVLEIRASAPQAGTAHATIVFEVVVQDYVTQQPLLVFDAPYYTGTYNAKDGLIFDRTITLSEGYDDNVLFTLEGDNAQWFSLVRNQNSVSLILTSAIPSAVLTNNRQLVFIIAAQRTGSITGRATIVISLTDDITDISNIGFDRVTYRGLIQNNITNIVTPITLSEGNTDDVVFGLYGELSSYFSLVRQGATVNIVVQTPIPTQVILSHRIIVLELRASEPQVGTAYASIVLEVIIEDDVPSVTQLVFDAPYYTGSYSANDGLVIDSSISLSLGYDESVQFTLEGESARWFSIKREQNSVSLTLTSAIPGAVLTNNRQLVFVIVAQRPGYTIAQATIVIRLTDDHREISNLGFDRVTYQGTVINNTTNIESITVIEGYTDEVTFSLYGALSGYFSLTRKGAVVNVVLQTPIPSALIPANRIVVLEIRASAPQAGTAHATIVFEVVVQDDVTQQPLLVFDAPYYTGTYNAIDGLIFDTTITLSEGYDDNVQFVLEGDNAQWFSLSREQNSVTLILTKAIPSAVLTNNRQLVFVIAAQRTGSVTGRATIIISLTDASQTGVVSFDRVLYNGFIQGNEVQHEAISLFGFSGTKVEIVGEYATLFMARVTNGMVTVQASGSVNLPAHVLQLALELRAADAGAVLLLNDVPSGVPTVPSVSFTSESYVLNIEITHTGLIGRVSAVADNGEAITYSVNTGNTHLQSRLSINNEGELYLSAPANSGVYSFHVIATTLITQARATAMVYLTVEAVTVCGSDEIVVPPLIVLDRDEEEPHFNLVPLNSTQHAGCHFSLTNRWPSDQTWLYVDKYGLHTRAIDREDQSIAFMMLSQVQVELLLHCESDNFMRTKRSTDYDYGDNRWILTDTILYNSRRSFVNLIVNDINDNAPIFVGKENEPIAVGYPVEELVERILPRSLVELKATDADIGENAAVTYWSSESELAVAPTTGFVHVQTNAYLRDNQTLIVNATDRNGQGLTGSIQLMVKLLSVDNIVVLTVKDAFLDDEVSILSQLSEAVGYEIKTLRSVVISDNANEDASRKKRDTTLGTVLQLYVYGLINRDPVVADRLIVDVNNNATMVNIVSSISLEDHLVDREIERDIGLLVATIVLSILLFLLILVITIWYYLKWRKDKIYNKFSDQNSLASRIESLGDQPKPEESVQRVNIEDLKKSERRLQEMLETPMEEVTVEPVPPIKEVPVEAILDLPLPPPDTNAPIVIQSIDKLKDAEESDDEFGEKKERRKSVVTFNENVEKIIHVEDVEDSDSSSESTDYEVYKL